MLTEKTVRKIKNLRSLVEGAMSDIAGGDEAEADNLYNDADTVSDFVGDKLYEILSADGWKHDDVATWTEGLEVLVKVFPHVGKGLRKNLARI